MIIKRVFKLIILIWSAQLAAQADRQTCASAEHRQFDFWVGTWNVTQPDGKVAGKNQIMPIQDGCIVHENWSSATSDFTGTSFNFYNTSLNRWEQLWLDNQGGSLKLHGQRIGDQMILSSEPDPKSGVIQRITWTHHEDGTVTQLWESLDGEQSKTLFDGVYKLAE